MLTANRPYLGNVSFGYAPMGDYSYSLYPQSSFGNSYGLEGDFRYSLFPYPALNSSLTSFGEKKKKKPKRKFLGYTKRPSGNVVKVYQKKLDSGKIVKVLGNGKKVNVKKIYKTVTKAKSG